MFVARCPKFGGCDLRIHSKEFKDCYYLALHYAKGKLHHDPDVDCLVFSIGTDDSDDVECYIAVSRTGLTIDFSNGVIDIERINWKSKQI